jgi:hypothetical protein
MKVSAELFQRCWSSANVQLVLIDTEYLGIDIGSLLKILDIEFCFGDRVFRRVLTTPKVELINGNTSH